MTLPQDPGEGSRQQLSFPLPVQERNFVAEKARLALQQRKQTQEEWAQLEALKIQVVKYTLFCLSFSLLSYFSSAFPE